MGRWQVLLTAAAVVAVCRTAWAADVGAAMTRLRQQFAQRAPALRLHSVRVPQEAAQWRPLEVTFQVEGAYANPFDPQQIDVQAQVTPPRGAPFSVPAFYFLPYEPVSGVTQLQAWVPFKAPGTACWKVRFTPPAAGEYGVQLTARDAVGHTAHTKPYHLRVRPGPGPGFVRVSPTNPAYFEDSADGSLFWGTGANVAWTRDRDPGTPVACYEYYFGKAQGQASSTRVWLCHWAWLEWTPQVEAPGTTWEGYAGAGYYNQMIAAELDRVFARAEQDGLRVMLVTEDNNEQFESGGTEEWASNPYNIRNGGPCDTPEEVFTSPEARRLYRNRLRYIVARWGYSTALWAIDAWNDESEADPAVRGWLMEMRDAVHSLVRGYRPLIYGSNFQANDLMDYAQAGPSAPAPDKPAVSQECEFTSDRTWFVPTLRHAIWSGLSQGLASVMVWPHTLVDELDAWRTFRPPLIFVADLPLNRGRWTPLGARVTSATVAPGVAFRRIVTFTPAGDVPDWGARAPRSAFAIDLGAARQTVAGLSATLYGTGRAEWRNPPTFALDLPRTGELVAEAEEIGSGDQTLAVSIDGMPTTSVTWRGGRRELSDEERYVRVPLPQGRHAITLDNTGGDWIRVRRYHVITAGTQGAEVVLVQGLGDGRQGFLYLRNLTYARPSQLLGQTPVPLTAVTVTVTGLADGPYRVSCFDTMTGVESNAQEVCSEGGAVTVTLPRLEDDLAVKLRLARDVQ